MTKSQLPPILIRADFDSDEEYQEYLAIEGADYTDTPPATEEEKVAWAAQPKASR